VLADKLTNIQRGQLSNVVQKPGTFINQVINFIYEQLPCWRDRKDRPNATAETELTSQLCAHLNSVSRMSNGWDILQFRTEERDAKNASRKIDLVAAPSATVINVDGRSYSDFDYLLPIECKRLPTPSSSNRDEREYIYSCKSSTGGIDRFKRGFHGAGYQQGMMIGFAQSHNCFHWFSTINDWFKNLVSDSPFHWQLTDMLALFTYNSNSRTSISTSTHIRDDDMTKIKITHAWVQMI